ncbi:unnamed protein product [Ranitomeya imitator]|uniref:E3 ubiquitin-protein ligase n=1 Tax=Ranitomeya imitator TaxID=111125 RepID=A0ABN9LIS4_9NEOB|nr:unnamed protein product [Ranitomeya imitator]
MRLSKMLPFSGHDSYWLSFVLISFLTVPQYPSFLVSFLGYRRKNGTLRCPTCQTLYGVKIGSQPPGKMTFHVIPHSLPGYPDCEAIRIIYYIAPGVQQTLLQGRYEWGFSTMPGTALNFSAVSGTVRVVPSGHTGGTRVPHVCHTDVPQKRTGTRTQIIPVPIFPGPGQPHPGIKFTAPDFPLHCYLPNTKKGREVLLLLIKAWESRLLFPLLPSHLPGVPDSVSISRIPLKTEFGSNVTGKGFPDSRYLDRVLHQLQDWGVSVD